jgi:hypothetical protein
MIDEDQRRARLRGDKMVGRELDYPSHGGHKADAQLQAEVATLRKELAELRNLVVKGGGGAATTSNAASSSKH